jgi:serine phosphatase RsbU (regulator of sigma subunit)/HAMP domain-containing protein
MVRRAKKEGAVVDIILAAPRQSFARFRKLHIREQLLLQVLIISIIGLVATSFAIWGLYQTGALLQDVRDSISPARYAVQLAKELEHVYGLSEAYQLSFNQPQQRDVICTEIDESKERIMDLQQQNPAARGEIFSSTIDPFLESVHDSRVRADIFRPVFDQRNKLIRDEMQIHAKAIEYFKDQLNNETTLDRSKRLSNIILAIENVHDALMRVVLQQQFGISEEDLEAVTHQLEQVASEQQRSSVLADAQTRLVAQFRSRLEDQFKSVGSLLQEVRADLTGLSDEESTKVRGMIADFEALFGDPQKSAGPETFLGNALQRAELLTAFRLNSTAQRALIKELSELVNKIVKKTQQRIRDAGDDANKVYERAVWASGAGLGASVALIIFVVSAIDRNILRRLNNITQKMRALARGDAIVVTGTERLDELGEMARALQVFWETEIERRELQHKLELANRVLQREVDESMDVAQRIQSALLLDELPVGPGLADQALLSRPCQLLGGDGYWLERFDDGYVVALIDCTGHGVPGAMMTIVTSIYMKAILHKEGHHDPAKILLRLAEQVQSSLDKRSENASFDAGFDAAICIIDLQSRTLRYAGGGIPLLVLDSSSGDMRMVKGAGFGIDGSTLGSGPRPVTREVHLRPGLRFYLASDGLATQPDNAFGVGFGWTRLTEILRETRNLPISQQNERVWATFREFSANTEQRDDVTLVGFAV